MTALDDREWLALGGLIRAVMHADGKVTLKEHRMIAKLAAELGPQLWDALARAEHELGDEASVRAAAARVKRPEARKVIRRALVAMAGADGVSSEEQALLDWVDAEWRKKP